MKLTLGMSADDSAAATSVSQDTEEIDNFFSYNLGATPDPNIVAPYVADMQRGETLFSVQTQIAFSSATAAQIQAAYSLTFGTQPKLAQVVADQYLLSSGYQISQLINSDFNAAEQTVTTICQSVLGQDPTASQLVNKGTQLLAGMSPSEVLDEIVSSSGETALLTTSFESETGNAPSAAQISAEQMSLENGETLSDIQAGLAAAATAVGGFFSYNLGIVPPTDYLASYVSAVLNGTTLTSVRAQISFSAVAAAQINSTYLAAFGIAPTPAQVIADQYLLASGYVLNELTSDAFNSAEQTVVTICEQVLQQEPTSSQLVNKGLQLLSGANQSEILNEIVDSPEEVQVLTAAFDSENGSSPTAGQIEAAQTSLVHGQNLVNVETEWATSNVEALYQELLGREADPEGLAGFVAAILSGATSTEIRMDFVYGQECSSDLQNAYEGGYGTALTSNQLANAQSQLVNGATLTQVTAPWAAAAGAQVTTLYEELLDREPDPLGLQSFTNALETGTPLLQVRAAIANGSEAANDLSIAYANVFATPITASALAQAQAAMISGKTLMQVEASWIPLIAGSTAAPQIWFGSNDPYAASGDASSAQFMKLFDTYGNWNTQANVFEISNQFAIWGSDQQLQEVFGYLNAHNIALAMAGLMLPGGIDGTGGDGVEGFNGPPGGMGEVAARIASLGGNLQYIDMDEPLYFGHQYDGPNATQWSVSTVAEYVAQNIKAMEQIFPNIRVGDSEPAQTSDLRAWSEAFQAAVGQPLSFFTADVNWPSGPYLSGLEELAGEMRQLKIPFGVYINGDGNETSNGAWIASAEMRLAQIEADPLIRPEFLDVTSWEANPTQIGPEGNTHSLLGLLGNSDLAWKFFEQPAFTNEASCTVSVSGPTTLSTSVEETVTIPSYHISLSAPNSGSMLVGAVLLTDGGVLSCQLNSSLQIEGNNSSALSIYGTESAIQTELANLSYLASASGTDHLGLTIYEGLQAPVTLETTITIAANINTSPNPQIGSVLPVHFGGS